MIVRIHDEVLLFVHVVPLMAVALVDVEINDHEPLQSKPLLHVASDERDIRVSADAFRRRSIAVAVVEPAAQVDRPTLVVRHVRSLN